jgi:HK97 family phage prohead protease
MAEKSIRPFRAYSLLEMKEWDSDKRVIRGIATSPSVDRVGDVIEMDGVKVAADIPLFLYHDSTKTVGRAKFEKPTKKGIPFEATLPRISEAGALKDRIDEAEQMVRYGLITAVSIGFRALEYAFMDGGGIRFVECEVYELSLVPVPAQPDAVIHSIKSADPAAREALISQIKSADMAARSAAPGAHAGLRVVRLSAADYAARPPELSGTAKARHPGAVFLN